ncbi:FLJ37770-like protein, partial [Acromyrmex echinatior]
YCDANIHRSGVKWVGKCGGGSAHFKVTVREGHKAFKEGREEVADEPRSGRPTTARTDENMNRVCEVLRSDRRLSIQYITDTLNM